MATALGNLLECSICFESFKTPKVLKCGHTFCLGCLERHIGDKRNTFLCPLCNQCINIPQGGVKMFVTNFVVESSPHLSQQSLSRVLQKCPNHKHKDVDYYCSHCNVGLCFKCVLKQHKNHETLDIECEETRITAIEELQHSQKSIQNKITNLEQTRSTLLETFVRLESLCDDSCAKVTKRTEQIISDLRKRCEYTNRAIKEKLEENRLKIEETLAQVTKQIDKLQNDINSNIPLTTETTLNILQSLPPVKQLEKLCENMTVYLLDIQYLDWKENNYSVDIDTVGSIVSKSYYIPNLNESSIYKFIFDVSDIKKDRTEYYSKDKFTSNNIIWGCCIVTCNGDLCIRVLPTDNPNVEYCIIDGKLSLLNIVDDSKTITYTESNRRIEKDRCWYNWWGWGNITWETLTDTNNGYLNSEGQFIVQFNITQIREISYKVSIKSCC